MAQDLYQYEKMVERALRVDSDTPWIHFRAAEMYAELNDMVSARAVAKLDNADVPGVDVLFALHEGDWHRAAERAIHVVLTPNALGRTGSY